MELFHKVAESWGAVRWKMLVIFAFFSIISTVLVAAAFVAFLNVVVRRENTNLIQERISAMVDNYNRFAPFLLERVVGCQTLQSNSPILEEYSTALWPEAQSSVTALPKRARAATKPRWLDAGSFSGVVVDQGNLEIRALRAVEREGCLISVLVRVPLTESFLNRLSTEVGLKISGTRAVPIARYRAERGMAGEVAANFIPGSGYPVPVLVSALGYRPIRRLDSMPTSPHVCAHGGRVEPNGVAESILDLALRHHRVWTGSHLRSRLASLCSAESTHYNCD
jgi:hypothetical protein